LDLWFSVLHVIQLSLWSSFRIKMARLVRKARQISTHVMSLVISLMICICLSISS
jgi:hypothetical protein